MRAVGRLTALFLASAIALTSGPATGSADRLGPAEAIQRAAAAAPQGVRGVFAMRVQAAGRDKGKLYLNSELDYRDQRNLTVAVSKPALYQLTRRYGFRPERHFIGKEIIVEGVAWRVRVDFLHRRRPTGKYYYQTHVVVGDVDQITVVGAEPTAN